jgi:hypothetical protein
MPDGRRPDAHKIIDGDVFIEPPYADEFAVSLSDVVSIQSEQALEIELKDGSEISASFAGVNDAGEQLVLVDGSEQSLALADVEAALEPEDWYDRVSHIDVNATINDGNTDSRNSLIFADTRLKLGDHRHLADLTIRRDETDGDSTKKQDLLGCSMSRGTSVPPAAMSATRSVIWTIATASRRSSAAICWTTPIAS